VAEIASRVEHHIDPGALELSCQLLCAVIATRVVRSHDDVLSHAGCVSGFDQWGEFAYVRQVRTDGDDPTRLETSGQDERQCLKRTHRESGQHYRVLVDQ
jgi:hypothetical protein